jgi:hypothetical protein
MKLPSLACGIKQTWVALIIGSIQKQDILPGIHHSSHVDHSYNIHVAICEAVTIVCF